MMGARKSCSLNERDVKLRSFVWKDTNDTASKNPKSSLLICALL